MRDVEVHRTGDGSRTLFDPALNESYHSLYGAVTESRHVFITTGLHALGNSHIDLLEVGLGTGLNMLLTWVEAERLNIQVNYMAIEPHPVTEVVLMQLDHCGLIGEDAKRPAFIALMSGAMSRPDHSFTFAHVLDHRSLGASSFDLVYFDAFAPTVQPELWTVEVFQRMHALMRPGGLLVTYCAKGAVRRAMQAAGFTVDRLPGPPGKRQMMRARKAL